MKLKDLYGKDEFGSVYVDPWKVPDQDLVEKYVREYGIDPDLHPMCLRCQIHQVHKYKELQAKKEERYGRGFAVKCEGVPSALTGGHQRGYRRLIKQGTDPEIAKKIVMSTVDPVAWCELMFNFSDSTKDAEEPWYLRPWQKEIIRCTSNRMVARIGRRGGKSFSMALKLLNLAFTLKVNAGRSQSGEVLWGGPKIMIITPFQSQLTKIFSDMEGLLKMNSDLANAVSTGTGGNLYIKTPNFRMEIERSDCSQVGDATPVSVIQGFVSGIDTKSDASGGGTMRGGDAHVIYLDEMDMIPEETLEKVIKPILLTSPKSRMIATSTPIGKRGFFYRWCLERPDFKEFYYPSTLLPQFEDMKDDLLEDSTEDGFAAEYLARFVAMEGGVFKPDDIVKAMANYDYGETIEPSWQRKQGIQQQELIIGIGVDWNKNAGTEYVVVGYAPSQGKYWVLDSVNISASRMRADAYKSELIRLNAKWKPEVILADEGYGHHLIEDLELIATKMKAKKNPSPVDKQTARLDQRLRAYNFSSKVTVRHPVNRQEIKKHAKDFLVENLQRVFEDPRGLIYFPEGDKALRKQLGNYRVLKISKTGRPSYGPENKRIGDHRLDALMLAVTGLVLETSMMAPGARVQTVPTHIQKQLHGRPNNLKEEDVGAWIRREKKSSIGTSYTVLDILRGNNPEQGRAIAAAQRQRANGRAQHRSRADIGGSAHESTQPEVLKGRTQHVEHTGYEEAPTVSSSGSVKWAAPKKRGRRRGRGSRSLFGDKK